MDAHEFVTFSVRREIVLAPPLPPEDILGGFLSAFQRSLREGGCTLIGHIKGILEDGESPPLFFSLTGLASGPQFKGGPLRPADRLSLTMTVIIAGVAEAEAGAMLEQTFSEHFRSPGRN